MKKIFKKISVLCFMLVFLAGNTVVKSEENVSLVINYYSGAISDSVIELAHEKFSDYKLEFNQLPADNDYDTKLRASLNSSAAPDIAAINSNIQDFTMYHEYFVNLLDYGTEELSDIYVDWKWESTFVPDLDEDYQIAMPIDIGPTALFYNVSAFEKADLPTDPDEVSEHIKTLDDYMEAAKQMRDVADMPMFQSADGVFAEQVRGMKNLIIEDDELVLGHGELKEIWDFVVEAINEDLLLNVQSNSGEGVNADQEGLYGSSIGASWGIADLKENGVDNEQWKIAMAPGNPSNYGGSYLAAVKTTDYPEAAAEVIKFLTSEEAQEIYYEERALFPSAKTLFTSEFEDITDELFGDEQYNKYFVYSAENLEYVPSDPRRSTVLSYFEDQINLVAYQDKDADQAWEDAVKDAEVLLDQ